MVDAKFYSVSQVAAMIGLSGETVRQYIERGLFPGAYRGPLPGSKWIIPEFSYELYTRKTAVRVGNDNDQS